MQLTQTLFAALFAASTAFAAPAAAANDGSLSVAASVKEWYINDMKRTCAKDDTWCAYEFTINPQTGHTTKCRLPVHGAGSSRRHGGPANCGDYTVTSGWEGKFGPGNGFTTLSVVDNKKKMQFWPAYTDKQLVNGKTVKPDFHHLPQALPKF